MRETRVSLPELGLIAMTRTALGIGLGLLLSERIGRKPRRAVGWALVVSGALLTIPLAGEIFQKARISGGAGASGDASREFTGRSREGASTASEGATTVTEGATTASY